MSEMSLLLVRKAVGVGSLFVSAYICDILWYLVGNCDDNQPYFDDGSNSRHDCHLNLHWPSPFFAKWWKVECLILLEANSDDWIIFYWMFMKVAVGYSGIPSFFDQPYDEGNGQYATSCRCGLSQQKVTFDSTVLVERLESMEMVSEHLTRHILRYLVWNYTTIHQMFLKMVQILNAIVCLKVSLATSWTIIDGVSSVGYSRCLWWWLDRLLLDALNSVLFSCVVSVLFFQPLEVECGQHSTWHWWALFQQRLHCAASVTVDTKSLCDWF